MEIDEHWKHSNRRQVIKVLGHLRQARQAVGLSTEHIRLVTNQSESCQAISNNINALANGIEETIAICGQAADEFKQAMSDPNATPAPIRGKLEWTPNITPMQRMLMREGKLDLKDTPNYITPKSHARAPKIPEFTLREPKPKKNRRRSKENPPL